MSAETSHHPVGRWTLILLATLLSLYSLSCLIASIVACTMASFIHARYEPNLLNTTFNNQSSLSEVLQAKANYYDVDTKTFNFDNWINWLFIALFGLLAHAATQVMVFHVLFRQQKLGQNLAKYIFQGVGLTIIPFLPFLLTCMIPLRDLAAFSGQGIPGAARIMAAMIYTVVHVFLGLLLVLLAAAYHQPARFVNIVQSTSKSEFGNKRPSVASNVASGALPA